MTEENKPQIASLEQPFGIDPPIVHCPICGEPSMKLDENGYGEVHGCNHLSFIFVGEVSDFEYMSDEFKNRLESTEYEYLGFDNFKEVLSKAGYGNELLGIEITYGGMAGGPIYFTDIIGFNYDKMNNE